MNENKSNAFYATIVDDDISKELEQAYSNGSLKQTGVIDTENYPENIPDQATCEILDELLLENKLPFREVRYCIGNNSLSLTEPYKEYNFDGRKFVRVEIKNNNNPSLNVGEYWIEVKPINEKTYFSGMSEGGNGIEFKQENFDKTDVKQYLDTYFSKDILTGEQLEEKGRSK